MKNLLNIILVLALAVLTMQCEVVSDDLLQSPNAPSPDNASPDFLLNDIQLGTAGFFNNIEEEGSEMTRMRHMFASTYQNAYVSQDFNSEWNAAYAGILVDVQTLIPLAQERELFIHEGMARVMKAYVLFNLADRFGDVPLGEALDANNFNPTVESARNVYAAAFAELDSARTALNKTPLAEPSNDVFYNGDTDLWITLANTLELKGLYQQRLIDDPVLPNGVTDLQSRVNTLLNGNVIDTPDEEWVLRFGTSTSNPDTRHPDFANNYQSGAAGGDYMANHFMNLLYNDKITDINDPDNTRIQDPRIRFYVYRQVDAPTTDVNELSCINNQPPTHYSGISGDGVGLNDPYCEDWNDVGYWGRDHGNFEGIPPDNLKRTTYGVYPAGGRYDSGQAEGVADDQGLQGAGIWPIWMPFFTDFVRAEVELTVNNDPAAARTALEDAIRNSIDYVINFAEGNNPAGIDAVDKAEGSSPSQADIDAYVDVVLDRWDNQAGSGSSVERDRELILGKEFFLALWGNGMEAYNLYRRIAPDNAGSEADNPFWNVQPNENPNPGQFYNTVIYPAAFVERNSNAQTKSPAVTPFWMTADPSFGNF